MRFAVMVVGLRPIEMRKFYGSIKTGEYKRALSAVLTNMNRSVRVANQ